MVIISPQRICYCNVKIQDVPGIVDKTAKGEIIERLLYVDRVTGERIAYKESIPFYKYQNTTIFGNNVNINPRMIEDYIALGGYSALVKALFQMTPEKILEEVKKLYRELMAAPSTDDNMKKIKALEAQIKRNEGGSAVEIKK